MDTSELKEASRGEWEDLVPYAESVAPDDLEQILSDIDNGRPERAKEWLRRSMDRAFEVWYAASLAADKENAIEGRL